MTPPTLLAVPNVSEGRDQETVAAIADAFAGREGGGANAGVRLLDVHSDRDHHRSVFTLAGPPVALADALLRGARVAVERIDVVGRGAADAGQHPHVGALDVAPIVYLDPAQRGAASAEALVLAERIGHELRVPVFLYGELSGEDTSSVRTRAQLRRGGVAALAARIAAAQRGDASTPTGADDDGGPIAPDFGPPRIHPRAGATLVAARPPLVAFNLQLAPPASIEDARAVAAAIREGGEHALPGLRAIGVQLAGRVAQVSINVERPREVPLARVVEAVRAYAEIDSAELVGLAPAAALDGFPRDLPMPGFDPARHVIENALGC
jgi:glutamate formiminotransferase / 5-formyltetrahydrofolate cyclo-ligase